MQPMVQLSSGATPSLLPQAQDDATSSMHISSSGLGSEQDMGYVGDISSNVNGLANNRFVSIDQCADLEN